MSNVPYLKGVRTRYVNILNKETADALDLLATAEYTVDETELILKLNNCVERLQLYIVIKLRISQKSWQTP